MKKKSHPKKAEHKGKSEKNNLESSKPKLMSDREIASDFAAKIHEKFDHLVKATILFGSQAKKTSNQNSDIDIVVIIDDASIKWDRELVSWYREELNKMVAKCTYSRELHINSVKLTTWWDDLLEGDPVVINILRYGDVLIDSGGFFNPLKILLQQGKIKATVESVYRALERAPIHLARSKMTQLGVIEGIYWALIDSSQAALITAGRLPPSPEKIPPLFNETFVDTKMSKIEYANAVRDIYDLHKKISHGEVREISGVELDKWQKTAELFISEMTRLIDLLIEKNKNAEEAESSQDTEKPEEMDLNAKPEEKK